jgi:hypothetical protein
MAHDRDKADEPTGGGSARSARPSDLNRAATTRAPGEKGRRYKTAVI